MASAFSILNKKYITNADPVSITFLELGSVFIFLSLIMPFIFLAYPELSFWPVGADWAYLLLLSILCTSIPFILSLHSLKHLSAYTTNMAINLEPIYGIFFAWILLKENKEVTPGFYLGVAIILASVFSYPLLKKIFKYKQNEYKPGIDQPLL
jgi:drug/metabolite transporter (DMT)-like permease